MIGIAFRNFSGMHGCRLTAFLFSCDLIMYFIYWKVPKRRNRKAFKIPCIFVHYCRIHVLFHSVKVFFYSLYCLYIDGIVIFSIFCKHSIKHRHSSKDRSITALTARCFVSVLYVMKELDAPQSRRQSTITGRHSHC